MIKSFYLDTLIDDIISEFDINPIELLGFPVKGYLNTPINLL